LWLKILIEILYPLRLLFVYEVKRNYGIEVLKVAQFVSTRRNWEEYNNTYLIKQNIKLLSGLSPFNVVYLARVRILNLGLGNQKDDKITCAPARNQVETESLARLSFMYALILLV
jgi:hypothetical protein